MSTTAPVQLVCAECGRANEPERIYCHDCGARLDHSTLPQGEGADTHEDVHKRVTAMFDGRGVRRRALTLKFVKLIAAAAVAALILLMLLPPVLPPVKKSEALPPQISLDLEGLTESHKPPVLRYSEDEVNAYTAYVLKKKENLNHLLLDFERATFGFHPGECELTVGRSIFGYTIYTSGSYAVQLQNGNVTTSPQRAAIGRLPVHPALMRYAGFLFADVITDLQRERKLLARVGAVELDEKQIVFSAR